MTPHSAALTIDSQAVRTNYAHLQSRCETPICPVLKADSYGLGACAMAEIFTSLGAKLFFTACLEEAVELKTHLNNPEIRIAALNGPQPGEEPDYAAHTVIPVLNSLEQIMRTRHHAESRDAPLEVFLHLDSGMNRLGLRADEDSRLLENHQSLSGLNVTAMLSHLACADRPDSQKNQAQRKDFFARTKALPWDVPKIFANSAGVFLGHAYHCDGVKPGAALYGIHRDLFPVLENVTILDVPIVQVAHLKKGETTGYDATFTAPDDMVIAAAACGYADGYPRYDETNTKRKPRFGRIHDRKAPLVGRVSMDLLVFDVSDIVKTHDITPGMRVILFDAAYDVNQFAADCGTLAHEVLTSLGKRVKRIWQ